MSLFSSSNVAKYVLMIGLVLTASLFSNKWKAFFGDSDDDEYELIRKYLLNDNPLYGFNKPKLWIHTKYAYNARKWQSFGSRSSYDLNQPYIHLTVRSLIHQCGGDFNICLIDDDSFHQLLPQWSTKLHEVPEPQRALHRQVALTELLYTYGGFLVPNTFACVQPLWPVYRDSLAASPTPFVVEMVNQSLSRSKHLFTPNPHFMGAPRRHPTMLALCNYLKTLCNQPMGNPSLDDVSAWCLAAIQRKEMTRIDGIHVGARFNNGKAIILEDLMQQKDLDIFPELLYGVVLPEDALLSRPKYQWFAVLPAEQVLEVDCVASRLLMRGILDAE